MGSLQMKYQGVKGKVVICHQDFSKNSDAKGPIYGFYTCLVQNTHQALCEEYNASFFSCNRAIWEDLCWKCNTNFGMSEKDLKKCDIFNKTINTSSSDKNMRLIHCSKIQCHSSIECLMAFCPHRSFTRVTFYNSIYFQKIQSYKICLICTEPTF